MMGRRKNTSTCRIRMKLKKSRNGRRPRTRSLREAFHDFARCMLTKATEWKCRRERYDLVIFVVHSFLCCAFTTVLFNATVKRIDRYLFNGLSSRTIWVSRHQKSNTISDFNEARDDGVAEASAGLYANHLHLAPDR